MQLTFLARTARFFLPLAVASSFLLTSCEDSNEVGLEVGDGGVPATAQYLELAFPASTVTRRDSLLTSNKNQLVAGTLLDATVGRTTATAYAQAEPYTANPDAALPAAGVADSAVLYLPYVTVNGTPDGRQALQILELTDNLRADRAYYGDSPAPGTSGVLSETTVKHRYAPTGTTRRVLVNRVRIGKLPDDTLTRQVPDTARQSMRFPLTGSLARRLYEAIGTSKNASLASFQREVLKGIAIVPKAGTDGALVTFDASLNAMQLRLYYRTAAVDSSTKKSFIWVLGSGSLERRHFSRIATDVSQGSALRGLLTSQDSVAPAALERATYVQGGVELGTRLWLTGLPGLRTLRAQANNRLVINRAELVVPVKPLATGVFGLPSQLYLYQADSLGRRLRTNGAPRTVQITGASQLGTGNPESAVYDGSQQAYRALVTGWLQAYVDRQLPDDRTTPTDNLRSLWLLPTVPSGASLGMGRAVLDAAPGQIKLKIYYSTLN